MLTKFEKAGIIGMWRQGNNESLIATVLGFEWRKVIETIKEYQFKLELKATHNKEKI